MKRHHLLGSVSAAQLSLNAAGMLIALRRRHAFDVPFMHGDPARVGSQSILFGTALSAPVTLLLAQAIASMRMMTGPDPGAARLLKVLGGVYVGGYLAERRVRHCLTRNGWDPLESPVLIVALGLSIAMFCSPIEGAETL